MTRDNLALVGIYVFVATTCAVAITKDADFRRPPTAQSEKITDDQACTGYGRWCTAYIDVHRELEALGRKLEAMTRGTPRRLGECRRSCQGAARAKRRLEG